LIGGAPALGDHALDSCSAQRLDDGGSAPGQIARQANGWALSDDFRQLRAPLHERLAHQIPPVQVEDVEGIKHDQVLRVRSAVLQRLERRPAILGQGDDLTIDHRLRRVEVQPRRGDAGVHRRQFLLVPGQDADLRLVL